ncbi:hypothetical protein JXA27_06480 [Aerococcaceae bacterium zg-B36]|uniref:hypothetical protein n=1 Tax=Aerococcaceae bacterium zg-252 TaxID=2796928 RepID=UPI001BD87E13|nr:hypothetical protein [Aerococcaceae bacterium zg-B36]
MFKNQFTGDKKSLDFSTLVEIEMVFLTEENQTLECTCWYTQKGELFAAEPHSNDWYYNRMQGDDLTDFLETVKYSVPEAGYLTDEQASIFN